MAVNARLKNEENRDVHIFSDKSQMLNISKLEIKPLAKSIAPGLKMASGKKSNRLAVI